MEINKGAAIIHCPICGNKLALMITDKKSDDDNNLQGILCVCGETVLCRVANITSEQDPTRKQFSVAIVCNIISEGITKV